MVDHLILNVLANSFCKLFLRLLITSMKMFLSIKLRSYKKDILNYFLIFLLIVFFSIFKSYSQVASLYSFSTTSGTYTAITGGTSLLTTFDDVISNVTIPSFNFNGTNYTSANISSNGFITFGATAPSGTNYTPISNTATYSGVISAFGGDLTNAASGSPEIRYQTVGSEFIVQWKSITRYNVASEFISFQIRLNTSTNDISIVYGGTITPQTGSNLQVGLRGTANTDYNNRTTTGAWSGAAAGGTNSSSCVFSSSAVPASGRTFTWTRLVSATLYDIPSNPTIQTAYNNIIWNTSAPVFTVSADKLSDRFTVELNTKSDFSGTAYTQTFTGTYITATKYDVTCNALSTSLPTLEATYFVRARASTDGGSTWGAYTSTTWTFSRSTAIVGYHYTASAQFDLGSLVSTNYGNFIVSDNNSTTSVADDDYMIINQGTNTSILTANADHYLTEGVTNYSGNNFDFLTVGSWYFGGAQKSDYVGFRFQNYALPQGCTVQSAYLNAFASNSGSEPLSNVSNPLYLKVRAVASDNCSAWADNTNTSTGDPKNRTRSSTTLDWDITANWSDALLVTSPDISTVVQDVINRSGYASGNSLGLILDYDGAAVTTENRHRYFSTPLRSSSYKAYLTTTFTNFTNNIQFTNIALANVFGASSWDELIFDVDKSTCGACDVTFEVRNTSGGALIASGNTSPISLGSSSAANVYVVAIMKRNNSPLLHSFTLTTNAIVELPIELTSFVGRKSGNNNILNWSTQSELNNDFFTIEKTVNGSEFEIVGIENGAGNSNQYLNYSLVDFDVKKVINYYRLKQTDFDAKYKFSEMISIDNRIESSAKEIVRIINVYGQEVDENYKGIVIIVYSDNSVVKTIQNQFDDI